MERRRHIVEEARALARPRLLVVDDLEDNRIIMSRRLSRRGFEVREAPDGFQALQMIGRERPDLVLLDIVMPEMDGFEVLATLREHYDDVTLPVIMATVREATADVVRALRMGANDYIAKPMDFDIAQARIEAHLARKHAVEAARRTQPELAALLEALRQERARAEDLSADAVIQKLEALLQA